MSFHRAPRIDANHRDVQRALEGARWYVWSLASIGGPVDLLVTDYDVTWLCEIKDGRLCPSARRLTRRCYDFLSTYPGPAAIVTSVEDAIAQGELARRREMDAGFKSCRRYVEMTGGVQR